MQRARRLASTAVVAVLAVTGLSACRNEPDVAAYIGKTAISADRVNAIYDDAKDRLAASVAQVGTDQSADPAAPTQTPKLLIDRAEVAMTLVGLDALRGLAQQQKLTAVPVPPAEAAEMVQLPAEAEFVKVYGEYRGYILAFAQSLGASLQSVQPTEADLRDVYQRLKSGGALPKEGDTSFENFTKTLPEQDAQVLQQNIGLRNALNAQIQKLNTTINPRYGNGELALVRFRDGNDQVKPLIVLSFVAQSAAPAVTKRP
jgi:hypothetical protein